jgi:glycosyltransferase involved in cell wall biosynthesis
LGALLNQNIPKKDYEVVVVDDGSKDDTAYVVKKFRKKDFNLKYFFQENQGQGVARNKGIDNAEGSILVFIGDDMIVKEDFLSQHLRYHLRYHNENEAVLGLTLWHPKLTLTPYMNWLTNGSSILGKFGGHQFAYEKLKDGEQADYNFFYTINISLKRSLLDKYPFDLSFSGYGWEDIELGYRLHKRVGLKIYYNAHAIGYHYHAMTEEGMAQRMRSIGSSAWIIHRKYPELKKVPPFWKKLLLWGLSNPLSMGVLRFIRNTSQGRYTTLYYYALSKKYFLEGLRSSGV